MNATRTNVESRVTAVTVYQGRAMVTRSAAVSLDAGDHLLVFSGLPPEVDRESLQVRGIGEATLGECSFDVEYLPVDSDERRGALRQTIEELNRRMEETRARHEACEKEKNFVDRIASHVTSSPPEAPGSAAGEPRAAVQAEEWVRMLDFYREQYAAIDARRLQAEIELEELERKAATAQAELDSLGYSDHVSRNIARVGVAKETAGDLSVELSYLLQGPTWYPVYSIRGSGNQETVRAEYDALVRQATGEDWEDVELRLSTAQVGISGVVPELAPWRLSSYRPRSLRLAAGKSAKEEDAEFSDEIMASAAAPSAVAEEEFQYDTAEVQEGGTSVVFQLAGGSSIGGDNRDTRVTIMREELPAAFSYATVPKLAELAYLTADLENTTRYPFLPGRANIFYDGAFVASSAIPLVMPGQRVEASMGVDEGVKVEYRFLTRFRKKEGIVSKRVSEQFDYQIRITNNRTRDAEVRVFDQFPIPQEKEIVVRPIAPVIKENTETLSLNDESRIEWKFRLGPGEVRELPLSFVIEYPVDSPPLGL
jgi:uncharacterized protein (TIGR02231 family)